MRSDNCPICGRDDAQLVGQVSGRDAQLFRCGRCGEFGIDALAPAAIASEFANQRHRLSYSVRNAVDRGQRIVVAEDDLVSLAATAPIYRNFSDGVDLMLLFLSTKAKGYMSQLEPNPILDYTRVPVENEWVFADLHGLASAMGFVDSSTRRITVDGWRRIDSLKGTSREHRQAFVAMWFDPAMSEAWKNGFVPGIELSSYYRAFRIDGKEHNNKIDDEIVAEIRRSGLLVADFTEHRGGVYFEAGLAQGLGLPVIWTCRKDYIDSAHFDTRQYSHIVWETPEDLREALDKRIRATVLPVGYGPPT